MEYPKSIISNNPWCYVCGYPKIEWHHVYFGKNRDKSTKWGLVCPLCYSCHRGTKGVHGKDGKTLDLALKKIGQAKFEELHTREEFVKEFGKNYL